MDYSLLHQNYLYDIYIYIWYVKLIKYLFNFLKVLPLDPNLVKLYSIITS